MVSPSPRISPVVVISLMFSALLNVALAMYQWFELLTVRRGGSTICSVNETINCATVWNSPFASTVHDTIGIPVAGLGFVWALSALLAAFMLRVQDRRGSSIDRGVTTIRIIALVGGLSVMVFIGASVAASAVCLTCIGTYVLTFTYAGLGLFGLPKVETMKFAIPAGAVAAMLASASFLLALPLGMNTPKATTKAVKGVATDQVATFIAGLAPEEKQAISDALDAWQKAPLIDVSAFPTRSIGGSASAPVHIVDFTDVLCSHCRNLDLALAEMRRMLGESAFTLESRYYPLDSECNPALGGKKGTGVRCLAAKIQICLEGNPEQDRIRHTFFENQSTLSVDALYEFAAVSGMARLQLDACIAAEATDQKLQSDIAYASRFEIQGTPLVLVNGKEAMPIPSFLLGLIASGGDAKSPLFKGLPPPAAHPTLE